jgi:hypothetical protein
LLRRAIGRAVAVFQHQTSRAHAVKNTFPHNPLISPNRVLREHAAALRRHLLHCQASQGRWFPAAVVAERLHRQMAPRFVTTVAAAALLLFAACGWI